MNNIMIGIDLGGTNLRIGGVGDNGQIVTSQITGSSRMTQASDPLKKLADIIKDFIENNHLTDISGVSIGVPSSVGKDHRTVIYTSNLKDIRGEAIFRNTDLATYLEAELSVPVLVSHDTDNILLYDVYANHLEKEEVIVGIYIGTGVGASVLIDGKNMTGANGVALDIGHMPFFKGTDNCTCGNPGCCECYASGWNLQKIRREYYPDAPIQELFVKHKDEPPLREFIYACAQAFATMATVFNPSVIIAGGGVIEMPGFPRQDFQQLVCRHTSPDVMNYGLKFVYSEPFPEKGILGAAIAGQTHIGTGRLK